MTLPVIETGRLGLRPFTLNDVDALHRLWTEPEVRQYLCDGDVITRERVQSLVKINYGFRELSFPRIEASTDAPNLASSKVMERAGMSFWKRETTNGLDTVYFAISRGDHESKISKEGNRAED